MVVSVVCGDVGGCGEGVCGCCGWRCGGDGVVVEKVVVVVVAK